MPRKDANTNSFLKELRPARHQGTLKAISDATESISAGHTRGSLRKEKKLLETSAAEAASSPTSLIIVEGTLATSANPPPSLLKGSRLSKSKRQAFSEASSATSDAQSSTMSSQRSRARQGPIRGGAHENGEEMHIWQDIVSILTKIQKGEARAKDLVQEIIDMEKKMKARENAGSKPSMDELNALDALYREQVRIAESQKSLLAEHSDLMEKITILKGMVKHNEESTEAPPMRGSNSRSSAMDFDGPSDSPAPSSAENRQVRKVGAQRTSSQPPRSATDGTSTPAEPAERTSKPKVVFTLGEMVAFKRKIPGKTEEQDWIQGIVSRVIGEGKSRRYDVQDPFPDSGGPEQVTYKSSASQMVPIPPLGTHLEDYEVGKRVLALYPDTTTFYRAEVKAMLDDGMVQLLFEDEAAGALKVVERRFVLDHKG